MQVAHCLGAGGWVATHAALDRGLEHRHAERAANLISDRNQRSRAQIIQNAVD